ncbi:transmembrane protease serine 12 [Scaptodrosophila lebanonensis]|uniref:Transmembrane protease serine 12 n=1 Tax=Drosophila lebanonensis TaxID=7225 RepID=A0A6J2UBH3_DROLE|nr:transmembrane protease serine 12 [Scaptodrosophila lebanonensis]
MQYCAVLLLLLGLSVVLVRVHTYGGYYKGDSTHSQDDDEADADLRRWQEGYEQWRRRCAKYDNPPTEEPPVSTRIAGGSLATPGMLPYQAGLLLRLANGDGIQCGGSLITQRFVLTAAHCVFDAVEGRVFLGATRYADEMDAAEFYNVTKHDFRIYEDYLGYGGYNDLALIRLPRTGRESRGRVQPIALALEFMQQALLEEQPVSTSGWGRLGDKPRSIEEGNLLHYVDVRVLEQERCFCYFLPGLVSEQRHICTDGLGNRGGCEGDSGGPLVYNWRNGSYLIGVITFGSAAGCEVGAPTVYTRVTAYLHWIRRETGQFNRNTLDFDAGLIKLTPKLNFNFFIGPAKLPATSEFIDYTNDLVIISGWGATSDTSGVSTVLNTVKMHVYANNLCADYYGSDIITEHKICAKANNEETKSTCGGDSGGPMYHNSSETVIGITSFGSIEGCEMGAPVGFTLIRSVINWINLVTN